MAFRRDSDGRDALEHIWADDLMDATKAEQTMMKADASLRKKGDCFGEYLAVDQEDGRCLAAARRSDFPGAAASKPDFTIELVEVLLDAFEVDGEVVDDVPQLQWEVEERKGLTDTTLLVPRKIRAIAVEVNEEGL